MISKEYIVPVEIVDENNRVKKTVVNVLFRDVKINGRKKLIVSIEEDRKKIDLPEEVIKKINELLSS